MNVALEATRSFRPFASHYPTTGKFKQATRGWHRFQSKTDGSTVSLPMSLAEPSPILRTDSDQGCHLETYTFTHDTLPTKKNREAAAKKRRRRREEGRGSSVRFFPSSFFCGVMRCDDATSALLLLADTYRAALKGSSKVW